MDAVTELVTSELLEALGSRLSAEEAVVRQCMNVPPPMVVDGTIPEAWMPGSMLTWAHFIAGLRTATVYVIDHRDYLGATDALPRDRIDLPPLPFSRITFEMRENGLPRPYEVWQEDNGDEAYVPVLSIFEEEMGAAWHVLVPSYRFTGGVRYGVIAYHVTPQGLADAISAGRARVLGGAGIGRDSFQSHDRPAEFALSAALAGSHIITARNIPKRLATLGRPQRRRFTRVSGTAHPQVYFVDLQSAGAASPTTPSGRRLTVRHMVRGHWRHLGAARGRALRSCTCCEPPRRSTWVAAYVKGPSGAPWKGRPIHRGSGLT